MNKPRYGIAKHNNEGAVTHDRVAELCRLGEKELLARAERNFAEPIPDEIAKRLVNAMGWLTRKEGNH